MALSGLVLSMISLTLPVTVRFVADVRYEVLEAALRKVIHCMGLLAYCNIIAVSILGMDSRKILFPLPFSEPSIFALTYGQFVVAASLVCSRYFFAYMLFNLLVFSLFFPSLTCVLFTVLALFCRVLILPPARLLAALVFLSIFVSALVIYLMGVSDYFSSRLDFSEARNITTLVWLQGWELAYNNFIGSSGVGVGIQMLGSHAELGEFSNRILVLAGKYMNISSGGFLAAKMIGELGVLGLIFSIGYVIWVVRFVFMCGAISSELSSELSLSIFSKKAVLLGGLVLGYFVEFFFRGYGYFSPSLYIFIVSLLSFRRFKPFGGSVAYRI
ncbi:hypothetical protein NAV33_11925 [Pseudomonas stutzeri]|uniref:hypothetical protein n=1 Tax=Stutzerimonas stutzeri TaxID=316 RepID=UPI00210ED2F3|nr:hypothetical protein [Stutzerimonas stutzeri]MCQ4312602.1 hypothetical protein [Stutzerimonas stutzeri]